MSRISDHIRRDAEHAARSDVSVALQKYTRRILEHAYAFIAESLTSAQHGQIDGESIGRDAAASALREYMQPGSPRKALEAKAASKRLPGTRSRHRDTTRRVPQGG